MGNSTLLTIYLPNIIGILLILTTLMGNMRRFRARNSESRLLFALFILALTACICEMLAYTLEGCEGEGLRAVNYLVNSWLFVCNIISAYGWVKLVTTHLNVRLKNLHKYFLRIVSIAALILLIINPFYPVAFSISAANVYKREELYWLFVAVNILFMLDSVYIYARVRKKSGPLKYFPILLYVVPLPIGLLIQSMFYGVSVVWACAAVSLCGILSSFQNEMLYRDKLTGTFNRYYFDDLKEEMAHSRKGKFTIVRVSLKNVKAINESLGREEGDYALCRLAGLLREATGAVGAVIRFEACEFIVVINTQDEAKIQEFCADISDSLAEYNQGKLKPYKLDAELQYAFFDPKEQTIEELMAEETQYVKEMKRSAISSSKKVTGIRVKQLSILLVVLEAVFVTVSIVCAVICANQYDAIYDFNRINGNFEESIYQTNEAAQYLVNCTVTYHRASITLNVMLCASALLFLMIVYALFSYVLVPMEKSIHAIDEDHDIDYGKGYEFNYLATSFNELHERNALVKMHLKDTAQRDALTGLLNRTGYENVINYYRDSEIPICFMILDADHFKDVNDGFGHEEGDKALKCIANLIKESFRENDFVIRYGGDEFIVIMAEVDSSNRQAIAGKLKKINDTLLAERRENGPKLSVSVGVAFSEHGFTQDTFERADAALYESKERGRCGFTFAGNEA